MIGGVKLEELTDYFNFLRLIKKTYNFCMAHLNNTKALVTLLEYNMKDGQLLKMDKRRRYNNL
jgi:hypothetical protein